jgi:hypothetical protein
VTPTLISEITRAPCVRDPTYPYPADHLPTCADLVACFAEGCPHQMKLDKEGNIQMSNFSNDVRCIYHILASRVLPVISHTMITIERACCLHALLTEAPILWLHGHFHYDVSPTPGQGFCVAIWGLDHLDCRALQGGHDRAKGGSAREGGYRCMLPQRKSSSLAGGKAIAKNAVTVEGSPIWWGTY